MMWLLQAASTRRIALHTHVAAFQFPHTKACYTDGPLVQAMVHLLCRTSHMFVVTCQHGLATLLTSVATKYIWGVLFTERPVLHVPAFRQSCGSTVVCIVSLITNMLQTTSKDALFTLRTDTFGSRLKCKGQQANMTWCATARV